MKSGYSDVSLPARGAWIEMIQSGTFYCRRKSLPARGAWIEIKVPELMRAGGTVAPREGSVD